VCQGRERVLVKDAFCEGLTSIAPDRHLALKGFGLKACRISDAIAGFGVFGFNGFPHRGNLQCRKDIQD